MCGLIISGIVSGMEVGIYILLTPSQDPTPSFPENLEKTQSFLRK